jgi:hypothetical protein
LHTDFFSAGTKVSRQSNPTVSVTMEAESQIEEEQVNIIEPSDPINYSNGLFAPGTDSMDSDAEIENHERRLEQTLLQLKRVKIQHCPISSKFDMWVDSVNGRFGRLP